MLAVSGTISEVLTGQIEWPLQKFIIPTGQRSRFPLFRKALQCRVMTREVESEGILTAYGCTAHDDSVDDVPLDILSKIW